MDQDSGFRAVFIGCQNVGKTCIIHQLMAGTFPGQGMTLPSLGIVFHAFHGRTRDNTPITIGLWDTPGQMHYRDLMLAPLRNATFIVLVFDLTKRKTFALLNDYLNKARPASPANVKIIILGNKRDITDSREVVPKQMYEYGTKVNAVASLEVSASTGDGIDILKSLLISEAQNVVTTILPRTEKKPEKLTTGCEC
jgi:small GTP-binding protein